MGWIDSIWGKRSDDPLGSLDPRVKEFLKKESPLKYAEKPKPTSTSTPTDPSSTQQQQEQPGTSPSDAENAAPRPPPQSLFPDGRYAHLWKTYTPLAELETATKSDSQKLVDIVDAFKERKKEIGRAAIENCVEWQEAWRNCHIEGDWTERMTMCKNALRKFERCYDTNARLLKALGYQSAFNRAPELEEEIQMQADTLYQRILTHEAAVEEAKASGQPAPLFDPSAAIRAEQTKLAQRRRETMPAGAAAADEIEPSELLRAEWDKRLAELPKDDRAAEEAALRADLQSKAKLARAAEAIWEASRRKKEDEQKRKEEARRAAAEARGESFVEDKKETKMVWQQLVDRWRGE